MGTEGRTPIDVRKVEIALEASLRELAGDRPGARIDLPTTIIRDSLELMRLLVSLEDKLGVSLNDDLAFDLDLTSRPELARGIAAMMSI